MLIAYTAHAAKKNDEPIRVSCIGNSITYGTGMQNPEADSYPAVLQRLLGDAYSVGRLPCQHLPYDN